MGQEDTGRSARPSSDVWKTLRKYIWLLWLLLMIPVVYFIVQVVLIMTPNMTHEIAMLATMTDTMDVTGQVVLNSSPIYGSSGGYPYYTVPTGQRVSADAEVALVFDSETGVQAMDNIGAIDSEIEGLMAAQQTVAEGGDMETLLGERQKGLYGILAGIEAGDYTGLDDAKNQMALASNKMQIAAGAESDFQARIAQLEALRQQYAAMAVPISTVTAPGVGFFVPSSARDAIPMDYETISALSPRQLEEALAREPQYYGSEVTGHIVSDFKWSFFLTVGAKDAERFVEGDKSLRLRFPDVGDVTVPVEVNSVIVDEGNDVAAVELYCEYVSPDVLVLRTEQAEIIFGEYKGIRLNKSALRMKDEVNEDGSVNTYKGVYVEFGNMVYFRRVDIIMEDENYMLIAGAYERGVNEVELYDKVVIDSGGKELHDQKIL